MNFSFYIAKRYLFAKSTNNAINIITLIASFGVVIGSLALFIILSGFSGLRTFSDSLLEFSDPDIKILPAKGKSFFVEDSLVNFLKNNQNIAAFSQVIEERVFLKNGDKEHISYIKGVDYNYTNVVKIDSALSMGNWLTLEFENISVIGNGISYKLSLGVLDYAKSLEIYVPKAGNDFLNSNSFRSINTKVYGIYSGTESFENKFVYVSLRKTQELLDYNQNQISAIEIKVKLNVNSDSFAENLQKELGNRFTVKTKVQLNELFYKVINTENVVSYLIFTLIVIVALFNVIGAIIMMIIDKKQNLKTLLSLGASLKEIKRVFIIQGFLLTFVGMFIGLTIGVVLIFIQKEFSLFMITPTIPYPVELKASNLFIVITTISLLGFLASKIASSRISVNFIEK